MFKKVASDVLGLSDIGTVIKPEDYDKVDADDYVMHEDGEKSTSSLSRKPTSIVSQTKR